MVAQDVNTRTKAEIEAAAMIALMHVLGGGDDSNIAKTLDAHKIKDPSLIMSTSDEETCHKITTRDTIAPVGSVKWTSYQHAIWLTLLALS